MSVEKDSEEKMIEELHKLNAKYASPLEEPQDMDDLIEINSQFDKIMELITEKESEFKEEEKLHKKKFIESIPNSHESRMEYFEMGRATGVLNMIKWIKEAKE